MNLKFCKGMFYRDFKLYLGALKRALILTVIFALLCGVLGYQVYNMLNSDEEAKASIALVDHDDSVLSRIALRMITENETVSKILNVVSTDEEDAREGMKTGRYTSSLILPKGYLKNVTVGEKAQGTVLLSNARMRSTDMIRAMALLGERLINAGQYGVFAAEQIVLKQPEHKAYYDQYILQINDEIISELGNTVGDYFVTEETSYSFSVLPLLPHTALLYILFVIELCTMFFYRSITADMTRGTYSRLCSLKGGFAGFVLPKIVYPFLYRLVLWSVCFGCCSLFISMKITVFSVTMGILAVLFFSAVGTFVSLALYGNRYGIAALSSVYLLFLFLNGGILPMSLLSKQVAQIGKYTPLGAAYGMTAPMFGADFDPTVLLAVLFWLSVTAIMAYRSLRTLAKKEATDL